MAARFRRLPMPRGPPGRAARHAGAVGIALAAGGGLRGLAVLDDVALDEQHAAGDLAPLRRAAQQELEVHREVLELLALRVGHDRARLVVGLDGETLSSPIASASSVSEAHRRANVRTLAGSSSGGSWYWSKPIGSLLGCVQPLTDAT